MGIPSESFEFEKKQKKNKLFDDIDDDSSSLNKFVLINDDFALLLTPFLHGKQYDANDETKLASKLAEAIKDSNEALAITHNIEQEVKDAFEDFDRVSLYLIKIEKQVDDLFRSIPYVPIQLSRIVKATMEKLAIFRQTSTEVNEFVHQNISVYVERKRLLEYFGVNNKVTRLLESASINLNIIMAAYYKAEEMLIDSFKLLNKIQAVGDSIRLFQSLVWSKLEAIGTLQEYLKNAKALSEEIKSNANTKCRLPWVQDRANLCEASLDMIFLSFEDIEINIQDGMKVFEDSSMDIAVMNDNLLLVQKNCEDILVSIGKNINLLQNVKEKADEAGHTCLLDVSLASNPFNTTTVTDDNSNMYGNDFLLSMPTFKDRSSNNGNGNDTIFPKATSPPPTTTTTPTTPTTPNDSSDVVFDFLNTTTPSTTTTTTIPKPKTETNIFKNELDLDMGLNSLQFVPYNNAATTTTTTAASHTYNETNNDTIKIGNTVEPITSNVKTSKGGDVKAVTFDDSNSNNSSSKNNTGNINSNNSSNTGSTSSTNNSTNSNTNNMMNNDNANSSKRSSVTIRKSIITGNSEDDDNFIVVEYHDLLNSLKPSSPNSDEFPKAPPPPPPPPPISIPPPPSPPSSLPGPVSSSTNIIDVDANFKSAIERLNKELKMRQEAAATSVAVDSTTKNDDKSRRKTFVVEDSTLPEDWIKKFSENDNRHYYVNTISKKRQWSHPSASSRRGSQV